MSIVGQVTRDGKKVNLVHLEKAKVLVMGNSILHFEATDEKSLITNPSTDPSKPKRFMLMQITQGQTKFWRVIVRSGVIPPSAATTSSNKPPQKYYIDFPFPTQDEEEKQNRKICTLQKLFRNALSRRRRSLLLASCMAYHPRLGMQSILGKEDGTASLMHRLIAPFILKDA